MKASSHWLRSARYGTDCRLSKPYLEAGHMKPTAPTTGNQRISRLKPHEISIEKSTLPEATYKAFNPKFGTVSILRKHKTSNQLEFEIQLKTPSAEIITGSHELYVTQSARNYKNQTAVGYNYIDLGDLQGKGIGYLFHCAAAASAKALGADLFVVDDALEPGMQSLCKGARMYFLQHCDSYSIEPAAGETSFRHKAIENGWQLDF